MLRASRRDVIALVEATKVSLSPDMWVNRSPGKRNDQGRSGSGECVSTAVLVTALQHDMDWQTRAVAEEMILDSIYRRTGKDWHSIPNFNDAPGRSYAEVMQALNWALEDMRNYRESIPFESVKSRQERLLLPS